MRIEEYIKALQDYLLYRNYGMKASPKVLPIKNVIT